MMKKLTGLILALLLVLPVIGAAAETVFTTPYFTIALPDGWDGSAEEAEKKEGMEFLGYFGEDKDVGLIIFAYLVYYEDLKNISLWNADADDLQDYAEAVMADFEDDDPVYLGTVKAGAIPFVLIKAVDEDGEYLYADTITNGYAIEFEVLNVGPDGETQYPVTDADIEQFKAVLSTFKPVT